ncbi:hypothetical protein GCM10011309_26250 [Litorimonas cladophorae]|uniref:DUF2853 family protein n=1 Tax=Litorimonas cladophorae TaxID=1220491 RepID=A0A918KSW2_9PROT|nr:DUF2853 family protein [Litorimonas cladophorae]GGX74824.1 hypothetical protein GCM10011309_26250 [Litorimonas cladophorae]
MEIAKQTPLNAVLTTARRTRRAYIGAHVLAFEFAQKRAQMRLSQLKTLGEYLVVKGETVEADAIDALDAAKEKIGDFLPKSDGPITVDVKPTRIVKKTKPAKRADMATDITPKTKTKKTSATKPKAAQVKTLSKDKYAAYVDGASKYDADLNALHIQKIVDHLGVALSSRDGKFVACTDPTERETVAKAWLLKKLGVEADMAALEAKVAAVCETMKVDRMKSRVTFYYLLAKNEGALGTL